jgi:dolichyl-phosphate-mannose-protein mannosyltransferase
MGLIALAVAAFLPAAWSGFLADDYNLLQTLRHAGDISGAFSRNDIGEAGNAGHFYRPVWVLWNSGLKALFGTSPFAFHLGNLMLYAAITILVWALARRLMDERRAWIAAAAFAVYPRHEESVAWVSGSTDLTATLLVLGALLCGTSSWRLSARLASAGGLAALAALSKEAAFVSPLLALLLLWALRSRNRWLVPGAMALAVVVVAVVRDVVIGGLGGYTAYPWTVPRTLASLGSYLLAAVTPPDLELLRYWYYLLLPAFVLVVLALRLWSLVRRGERDRLRLAAFGFAWFAIGLLPLLNIAVDLNNANGERLMFLASVGLALAFAVLVEPTRLLAAVGVGALALSMLTSTNWLEAERISNRVLDSAVTLAPRGGELVLLSNAENYRTAHVFPGGSIDNALAWRGVEDVGTGACSHVVVRETHSNAVSFQRVGFAFRGRTTWDAPFDIPVLRPSSALTPDCSYKRDGHGPPGLGLGVLVTPTPPAVKVVLAYFDGYSLRPCC